MLGKQLLRTGDASCVICGTNHDRAVHLNCSHFVIRPSSVLALLELMPKY
jgi:hypothetical protein